MTTKQKILLFIPIGIVAGLLVYCWTIILATSILATWRHYVGLILFVALMVLFSRSRKLVIAIGIYLVLATGNLLAITPSIITFYFWIGPVSTPHLQGLALGIFLLYCILNCDTVINFYLDHKEKKQQAVTGK
jgi:hypothetical protein